MEILDVNVLVNAYRRNAPRHPKFRALIEQLVLGQQPFAVASITLSGLLRIVTHPRIFDPPSTLPDVLIFAEQLRSQPHCLLLEPGSRHWDIFADLCKNGNARGNLISDAYLAAIAIENGAELVTDDRGFGRWPGLRWRRPAGN